MDRDQYFDLTTAKKGAVQKFQNCIYILQTAVKIQSQKFKNCEAFFFFETETKNININNGEKSGRSLIALTIRYIYMFIKCV